MLESASTAAAASATAVIAPARIAFRAAISLASRLSLAPSPPVNLVLRDAAAVTAAAARSARSPIIIAALRASAAASDTPLPIMGMTRTVPSTRALAPPPPATSAYAKTLASAMTPPVVTFAGSSPVKVDAADCDAMVTSTSPPLAPTTTYPVVYLKPLVVDTAPPLPVLPASTVHPLEPAVNIVERASPELGLVNICPGVGGPTTTMVPVVADPSKVTPSCLALSVKT
mmetsp:Transcript_5972/g.14784  ORF Transcript_5972/g.14784 Transcript_5972/m.14784 type:complete len:229 (+) Transcript_5972:1414-2100(+)